MFLEVELFCRTVDKTLSRLAAKMQLKVKTETHSTRVHRQGIQESGIQESSPLSVLH